MAPQRIWSFFYGSYMDFGVLKELGATPERWEVARLGGFDLSLNPRANLVRSDRSAVYGILASLTHEELDRLYSHAREAVGDTYLPEAVLVESKDANWRAALCYIAPSMEPGPPTTAYIDRILRVGREYGFPQWYIERVASYSNLAGS